MPARDSRRNPGARRERAKCRPSQAVALEAPLDVDREDLAVAGTGRGRGTYETRAEAQSSFVSPDASVIFFTTSEVPSSYLPPLPLTEIASPFFTPRSSPFAWCTYATVPSSST